MGKAPTVLENTAGRVRIRSNVVIEQDSWGLVPGEIVERYRRGHFSLPNRPQQQQRDEKMYYEPCSICRRTADVINLDGCDECRDAPSSASVRANRERHDAVLERVRGERTKLERNDASLMGLDANVV